jgi:hypothetical protein
LFEKPRRQFEGLFLTQTEGETGLSRGLHGLAPEGARGVDLLLTARKQTEWLGLPRRHGQYSERPAQRSHVRLSGKGRLSVRNSTEIALFKTERFAYFP